ncbi:hypothetical protein GCM10022295_13100 [Streptomyces osmaniensis]|uniref:Uncharacterized protein n=1 Tax=Streptomyces osmaniensis TaxID=593134 RepID=A0ABP6VCP8_9ACTN
MACPGAACHNLAELPGVSGTGPGSPLWHGYLFATLSDQLRHPVQLAPSRRSLKATDAQAGDRTQGSPQYSIWATCVDWHAAQLLARGMTRPWVGGFWTLNVAYFTQMSETELMLSTVRAPVAQLAGRAGSRTGRYAPNTLRR